MKRLALVIALAMILATLASGIAVAAPVNNPQAEIITIACDNNQSYDVVVGPGLSAHILDSDRNRNLIPVAFTANLTEPVLDPETGELVDEFAFSVGQGKRVGQQNALITCTAGPFTEVVPELGQEITYFITVEGFLTPRGR